MKANPTSFLRFPETFPSANMPPEAAARKWAVIAADAQQQASQLAAEQQTLEQMSSANMAKLQVLYFCDDWTDYRFRTGRVSNN